MGNKVKIFYSYEDIKSLKSLKFSDFPHSSEIIFEASDEINLDIFIFQEKINLQKNNQRLQKIFFLSSLCGPSI
jgi:hypothetical protein